MEKTELEILILIENKVYSRDLIAEHGLSFLLKYRDREYLFDTGQGLAIINNARKVGVDLNKIDGVFLSHGHDDHTGGLCKVLEINPDLKVYGHPDIFKAKYSHKGNKFKEIGFNIRKEDIVNFVPISKLSEITDGIWLSGEIPGQIEPSGKYKTGSASKLANDYFKDDQSLIIETKKGLVVILGCSHAGVVNILKYIKANFKDNIYAVFGGMHLKNKERKKVEVIINYLSDLDLQLLVPMHCTGVDVVSLMKTNLGNKVKRGSTGMRFKL